MSDGIDLETYLTEYESASAELRAQRSVLVGYERAFNEASAALVQAIIDAGLTEYGPITSHTVWHQPSETWRRVWENK